MWKTLIEGDIVDIVAPANAVSTERLHKSEELLREWGLVPRVSTEIFGTDLLYANSDASRFEDLKRALYANDSKAVWCIRGGSGCTRLVPKFHGLNKPANEKIFIGFSDITALQIFMHQKWGWSPIHGPALSQVAEGTVSPESIQTIKEMIFGLRTKMKVTLKPLNSAAMAKGEIKAIGAGGNVSLAQCSIGTAWELNSRGKIIFFEEVNERPYRVIEQFEHLRQAGIFKGCAAIVLGDFIAPKEKGTEQELFPQVLRAFAEEQKFPVFSCGGVGHGSVNTALPIGVPYHIKLGANPLMEWSLTSSARDL